MQIQSDAELSALAQSIQLAITPVFLLSGVAVFLGVLNARLIRVIDRTRILENREDEPEDPNAIELAVLFQRRHWINRAITLCTICAVLISLVVAVMFIGALVHFNVARLVAFLFIASMIALIVGMLSFLREIHLGVRYFRHAVPPR
jgi:hypothetical protein